MFNFELVLVDQTISRAQWAGVHREGVFTQLQVSSTRVCGSPCLAGFSMQRWLKSPGGYFHI